MFVCIKGVRPQQKGTSRKWQGFFSRKRSSLCPPRYSTKQQRIVAAQIYCICITWMMGNCQVIRMKLAQDFMNHSSYHHHPHHFQQKPARNTFINATISLRETHTHNRQNDGPTNLAYCFCFLQDCSNLQISFRTLNTRSCHNCRFQVERLQHPTDPVIT
mgnify:CR=1 FL=1